MWELYHRTAPWVKVEGGTYSPNPMFPSNAPGTPEPYAALCTRCLNR